MQPRESLDLTACEREPIHVPGAIQPHGSLLAVQDADLIVQAAGDAAGLLPPAASVLGRTVHAVLGISLADLIERSGTALLDEPVYLGTVGPFGGGEDLVVIAHRVDGAAIIEAEPAGRQGSAAGALGKIRLMAERLGGAIDLLDACDLAAREVRSITGYDRVMVYRFLSDSSGAVIAEDRERHLPPFLNHRYPASDIPAQARELYRRNAIRVIPDVNYTPSELLPATSPATGKPLDMSHCSLRSVSPVHIRYLNNMGVGASMSVSLLSRGELWGLIACHNSTAKLVPYEVREACRHVAQILSQQMRARQGASGFIVARELAGVRGSVMRALREADDPVGHLLDLGPDLRAIVRSEGMAVLYNERVVTAGHTPERLRVHRLAAWLDDRKSDADVFATEWLSDEYPDAEEFASAASGLLSIALTGGDDPIRLMWFRAEQLEEINWAGNPHEPAEPGADLGTLNPRRSFETWKEIVRGRSRPWESVDIEAAEEFRLRADFVLQQKKVATLNRLLAKANERLTALASTDGLTGVANRRSFDDHLKREWARSRRLGSPLALLILDLDFFKQYNDHYGHAVGDECLKQVAKILQEGRRGTDLAARVGGEEFSLLLPDTDVEGAISIAEGVRSRIENLRLDHADSPLRVVTATIGVTATGAEKTGTAEDLMETADKALYDGKRRGRNRVVPA